MKKMFLLLVSFVFINIHAQCQIDTSKFNYPVSERTHKICYEKAHGVSGISKGRLFRRACEFIASQNFDRTENITCKNGSSVAVQFFDKPINFQDSIEGKLLGNGFVNFQYRHHERFVITFKYKISVRDNEYKYQFTDFRVLEFISAPKNKSRSSAFVASQGALFASGSSNTVFNANQLLQFDLEDFTDKRAYERTSDEVFRERIKRMIGDLKITMADTF